MQKIVYPPTSLDPLLQAFRISLEAQNRSPKTVEAYLGAVHKYAAFAANNGMPTDPASISREHIESFIADVLKTKSVLTHELHSPATASAYYAGLRAFFKWLVEMGELRESPMSKMKPVKVPPSKRRVPPGEVIEALLKTCKGRTFNDRRDRALILLFAHTGLRRKEMAEIQLEHVNMEHRQIFIPDGKGGLPRAVSFSKRAAQALNEYITFARRNHPHSNKKALWLTARGALTPMSVYLIVRSRAEKAGITEHIHPHLFRHYYVDLVYRQGMPERDIMSQTGHRNRDMLDRYAASAAASRSHEKYMELGIGDNPVSKQGRY